MINIGWKFEGIRVGNLGEGWGVERYLVGCHLKVQHFYTVDLTFLNGRSLQRIRFFCLLHIIQKYYTVDQ